MTRNWGYLGCGGGGRGGGGGWDEEGFTAGEGCSCLEAAERALAQAAGRPIAVRAAAARRALVAHKALARALRRYRQPSPAAGSPIEPAGHCVVAQWAVCRHTCTPHVCSFGHFLHYDAKFNEQLGFLTRIESVISSSGVRFPTFAPSCMRNPCEQSNSCLLSLQRETLYSCTLMHVFSAAPSQLNMQPLLRQPSLLFL